MGRTAKVAIFASVLALIASVGGASFIISLTKVSPEAARSSVLRSENGIENAWKLPAAATFKNEVTWQSNPSMCGPASVANALRSLNELAVSESAVLSGTGRCWSGICFMGLTLDELAEVTRTKTKRTVTVLRDLSPEEFLRHLRRANETGRRYIVNLPQGNFWCRCGASFPHRWISRGKGHGFCLGRKWGVWAVACKARTVVRRDGHLGWKKETRIAVNRIVFFAKAFQLHKNTPQKRHTVTVGR